MDRSALTLRCANACGVPGSSNLKASHHAAYDLLCLILQSRTVPVQLCPITAALLFLLTRIIASLDISR